MYFNQAKQGFTLIELLVVVLIIGILAAVALPQYEKAVEKSRATQALTLLKSVAQAAEVYHTATGEYPSAFDQLDVDLPAGWTGNTAFYSGARDHHSNGEWSIGVENSSIWKVIFIGKISGKYKGAGFAYFLQIGDNSFKTVKGKIACVETIASGVIFEQSAGAYCQKIMQGSYLGEGNHRAYFL